METKEREALLAQLLEGKLRTRTAASGRSAAVTYPKH
jgi:hypothetical protein